MVLVTFLYFNAPEGCPDTAHTQMGHGLHIPAATYEAPTREYTHKHVYLILARSVSSHVRTTTRSTLGDLL
jgi:hypothetical protein